MVEPPWVRVPVGPHAPMWRTVAAERRVLAVVHNVTALTRLLDVLAVFEADPRVQVVFTWTRSSPFIDGVPEAIAAVGGIYVPWEQAVQLPFELAVSASQGGDLHELLAPLVIVGHGMGYNKYSPRKAKSEKRKAKSDSRWSGAAATRRPAAGPGTAGERPGGDETWPRAGAGERPASAEAWPRASFGLGADQLLRDGEPIAEAFVLSHDEQLSRLARSCPPAVENAVVAGDPCFDRLLASRPVRDGYRAALGVEDGHQLVVISSTWGENSLFGARPEQFARITAELSVDRYRVLAVLHPNIWHGHGAWQVRTWLADAMRSGLMLVPPMDGWRAALVAADCVIGDHGSTTFYGAALGIPVLLGHFPLDAVDPSSPVGQLGSVAPALADDIPVPAQVAAAITQPQDFGAVTELTTSHPGKALLRLRAVCYDILDLPEPAREPAVLTVPTPEPIEPHPTDKALVVQAIVEGNTVHVTRHPAAVTLGTKWEPADSHLLAYESSMDTRWLNLADVVIGTGDHPHARVIARTDGATCVAQVRDAGTIELTGPDPTVLASAALAWHEAGRPLHDLSEANIILS
jgi:hypothetical protein